MRFALLPTVLAGALLAGCTGGSPTLVAATPTPKPSGAATRPAALPAGTYTTMKLRVQKVRNFYFKEKATGSFIPPRLAQTLATDAVTLEPGDYDELLYESGSLRFASYGRTERDQPYVVQRALEQPAYQAIEDSLNEDGIWGFSMENWDAEKRYPFYYLLYTVGDAGYQTSFTPSLSRLRKTGVILEGYFSQMSGGGKLPAGTTQMVFAQQAVDGTMGVRVSVATSDVGGDPIESPYSLRTVTVDTGSGPVPATVPDGDYGFTYPQPVGDGNPLNVKVSFTGMDSATHSVTLPVRSKKK